MMIDPPELFPSHIHEFVHIRIIRTDVIRYNIVGQHSEYIVEINITGGEKTSVSKRFRDFLNLHFELIQALGNPCAPLPEPPPKKIWGNLEPDFVEERRQALEEYLLGLILHPSGSITNELWLFLDVDDSTIAIIRFLGLLHHENAAIQRIEDIRRLINDVSIEPYILQDLVIERLVKCMTSDNVTLVLRACLALTQICIKYERSYQSLVRLNAIPSFITALETFPTDILLTRSIREFLIILVTEHPSSILVFIRSQNGMSHIHRVIANTHLSLFHSFFGLLFWLSLDQTELQNALADPESTGLDILESLYRSCNSSAQILAGLIFCTLLLKNKFHSADAALQASNSVMCLPDHLSTISCRRGRLKLSEDKDLSSDETMIDVLDFDQFNAAVQKATNEEYLNVKYPCIYSENQSTEKEMGEVEKDFNIEELDYSLLVVALCSCSTSQRIVDLLRCCLMNSRNHETTVDPVCCFLLWAFNLIIIHSYHSHTRGLLSGKRKLRKSGNDETVSHQSDKECVIDETSDLAIWNIAKEFSESLLTKTSGQTEATVDNNQKLDSSQISYLLPFSFNLRVHINSKITIHNHYLVRYLQTPGRNGPPWQRFIEIPESLQLIEHLLKKGSTWQVYAASILFNIPWTYNTFLATQSNGSIIQSNGTSFGEQQTVKVIPLFKDLFSLPFDHDVVINSPTSDRHVPRQPYQTVLKSLVPSVEFNVPYRLLRQRMEAITTLLKFCMSSTEQQRQYLKQEDTKLQEQEKQVNARQIRVPLQEDSLIDYIKHFKSYLVAEDTPQSVMNMSKVFIQEMKMRLETQGLKWGGLTVATESIETELVKLSTSTERVYEVHANITKQATALRQARAAADSLLRTFADRNSDLKKSQEATKGAKRDAQRKRDRWIDFEQSIAEAPERTKKIVELLAQREAQEEEISRKIVVVQRMLADAEAAHNDASAKSKQLEVALNNIEATILDLQKFSASNNREQQKVSESNFASGLSLDNVRMSGSEVENICSRLSDFIKEREAFKDLVITADVAKILEFLHSEESELRSHLMIGRSDTTPRVHQLREKLLRLELQSEKRKTESHRLRAELQAQSDHESLVQKSAELQSEVRISDADCQALVREVETLVEKVRLAETELEAKKTDVRVCEQEFFTSLELLSRLTADSNNFRQTLLTKILDVEKNLNEFLSDVTSSVEDSGYVILNRGLLRHALDKESRTREEFQKKTRELINILENVDATLAKIDLQIQCDSEDHRLQ